MNGKKRMLNRIKDKTFKREFAFMMFLHLVYVSSKGIPGLVEILIWPYMLFILAAYGMDTIAKQLKVPGMSP